MNSKHKKIYDAVIIGAGRIASGFDTPRSKDILTHAHAIAKESRLRLTGITDINERKGKKAEEFSRASWCPMGRWL